MKFRTDFVTNSSSSSYIVIAIKDEFVEEILRKENLKYNADLYDHEFKADKLEAVFEDGGLRWLCQVLYEDDLRKKTLNTLEWELTEQLNKEYNLGISVYDLSFKQDVIYE